MYSEKQAVEKQNHTSDLHYLASVLSYFVNDKAKELLGKMFCCAGFNMYTPKILWCVGTNAY